MYAELEDEVRGLLAKGQIDAAAALVVERLGGEVLSFLAMYLGNDSDGDDAFSQTCEDLLAGLARFEWRSSLRTWVYTLARNSAHRLRRSPHRKRRHVAISQVGEAEHRVRTRTAPYLRTEVKDAFAAIRAALDPEDRALLTLRVDREMEWKDIALVMFPGEAPKDLARVTARLRKRFQSVKEEIRERAKAAGLLEP